MRLRHRLFAGHRGRSWLSWPRLDLVRTTRSKTRSRRRQRLARCTSGLPSSPGAGTCRPGTSSATRRTQGEAKCEAKMILGGRFLQQDYTSSIQGQPFLVLQLWGYDNASKKSIEIMMDTMGTGVLHNEGTVSEDGKVITNMGESRDPATGKPYKLRTVATLIDRDNFVHRVVRHRRRRPGKEGRHAHAQAHEVSGLEG